MDPSEMIEIDMLESKIGRLTIDNQTLRDENQRLRSDSNLQERAQSDLKSELDLLQSKKERNETNFGRILLAQEIREQEIKDKLDRVVRELDGLRAELDRVAGERDGLGAELDLKNEEVEGLFLDLQELEKTNQEDQMELRKAMAERALLLEQKERWDDRVDKITEDNTEIILTLLTSQSYLEEQTNRREAIMEAFQKEVLEMVRRTRRIVMAEEEGEEEKADVEGWPAWKEGETSAERDDEIGNVVKVMASPVEQELKEIKAAAAAAAATRSSLSRKKKVEEDEDEMETMITWSPGKMEGSWGHSKDYWRQKGKKR